MNRFRWRWLAVLALALALIAAACSSDDDSSDTTAAADDGETATTAAASDGGDAETLKVAFVHVGPTEDKGWSWAHNQGAEFMQANLQNVEVTTLESIPEGADSQRVFEDLAADGNQLIFGTSFGYMEPMLAAAENFPDVTFEHATGYLQGENMGNYFGAAEEGRYLTGMAAGAATETGQVGYVAAFPIPEVLRGINAFTLGAQRIKRTELAGGRLELDQNLAGYILRQGHLVFACRGRLNRHRRLSSDGQRHHCHYHHGC